MDPQEKSFEFAHSLCTQLISLSTGLIALTITFWKDVLGAKPASAPWLAYCAWYAFLLSVLCGIWMLMALTGVLAPKEVPDGYKADIRTGNVVIPSALQILSFVAGLVLLVVFGTLNYR